MTTVGAESFTTAVRAQGSNLRSSGAAIRAQLQELDFAPWRDRSLGLVGMGASYNAVLAGLGWYWSAGLAASPWLGSDLIRTGALRSISATVGVSQSGRSPEVISSLSASPPDYPKLAITNDRESPIGAAADVTLSLALLEDSAVRTLGYTGTLQALGLLRDALAPEHTPPDWDALADEVDRQVPAAEGFADRVLPMVRDLRSFDVVGSGLQFGTAVQGALLLREVCRLPAAAYDTYQYLHGPVEAAEPGLAVLAIGSGRETKLATSLAEAGATVLLVTSETVVEKDSLSVFNVSAHFDDLLPMLEILPLQTLAVRLAIARDVPVGEFRHDQDDTKVD
jgi:glucosamine--fructose-6-phosphate aminotransferase (isomerizing)